MSRGQQNKTNKASSKRLVIGRCTAYGNITAEVRKIVYYVDNFAAMMPEDEFAEFVSHVIGVTPLSVFRVKPRLRRFDGFKTNRSAFRVCINAADGTVFLNPERWPDGITVSRWMFKPAGYEYHRDPPAMESRFNWRDQDEESGMAPPTGGRSLSEQAVNNRDLLIHDARVEAERCAAASADAAERLKRLQDDVRTACAAETSRGDVPAASSTIDGLAAVAGGLPQAISLGSSARGTPKRRHSSGSSAASAAASPDRSLYASPSGQNPFAPSIPTLSAAAAGAVNLTAASSLAAMLMDVESIEHEDGEAGELTDQPGDRPDRLPAVDFANSTMVPRSDSPDHAEVSVSEDTILTSYDLGAMPCGSVISINNGGN
jgi:hypothetical protein